MSRLARQRQIVAKRGAHLTVAEKRAAKAVADSKKAFTDYEKSYRRLRLMEAAHAEQS